MLSESSKSVGPHTSGAVLRESDAESGRAEDWGVVVLIQDGHSERNAAVQTSDVFGQQVELNARIVEGLAVQCGSLTDVNHTSTEEKQKPPASLL